MKPQQLEYHSIVLNLRVQSSNIYYTLFYTITLPYQKQGQLPRVQKPTYKIIQCIYLFIPRRCQYQFISHPYYSQKYHHRAVQYLVAQHVFEYKTHHIYNEITGKNKQFILYFRDR